MVFTNIMTSSVTQTTKVLYDQKIIFTLIPVVIFIFQQQINELKWMIVSKHLQYDYNSAFAIEVGVPMLFEATKKTSEILFLCSYLSIFSNKSDAYRKLQPMSNN